MDSNPQAVKPISDDQELAKVLAGVAQQTDEPLQFDTPPVVAPTTPPVSPLPTPTEDPVAPVEPVEEPTEAPVEVTPPAEEPAEPTLPEPVTPTPSAPSSDLSDIKKDALNDLRPLVDKLDIAPEEKFDTYLLLIRSTDDNSLIAPAYAAAQAIVDEPRKAQALLDVIKEIDYLSKAQ